MNSSNSWAEFAALFCTTHAAFLDHERAKGELKALVPEDRYGVRGKHSKAGAISLTCSRQRQVSPGTCDHN
jgi:hypothetical protein